MTPIDRRIAREAKAMMRIEVLSKAFAKQITWLQAADILGITARHLRRVRRSIETHGLPEALRDKRQGTPRRPRVSALMIAKICRLRKERYSDFSVRHFYEFITEKHGLKLSYSKCLAVLQGAGLAEKAPRRGQYRRKRERRPMRGMMLHLDASTHVWIADQPQCDLVAMLDDADGKLLYARLVDQEGTRSTLAALHHVLARYGRFCELYTDRGSHFCTTTEASAGPNEVQQGQVHRVLKTLGIRHILARSPQARGRSERAFRTLQGRLPQELRAAGICSMEEANQYLEKIFIPSFNRRFTVRPAQPESAFSPIDLGDLAMLLSIRHERVVRNDNTVQFQQLTLQLTGYGERVHFARCPVTVHELLDGTFAISYDGMVIGRFDRNGAPIDAGLRSKRRAA